MGSLLPELMGGESWSPGALIDYPVPGSHLKFSVEPVPQDSMAPKDCTQRPENKSQSVHQSMESFPQTI